MDWMVLLKKQVFPRFFSPVWPVFETFMHPNVAPIDMDELVLDTSCFPLSKGHFQPDNSEVFRSLCFSFRIFPALFPGDAIGGCRYAASHKNGILDIVIILYRIT